MPASLPMAVLTAQAFGALLVAVLLWLLFRSYNRIFTLYWSYAWAALAIYLYSAVASISLYNAYPGATHPARVALSIVSISAALCSAAWLLFGTRAIER